MNSNLNQPHKNVSPGSDGAELLYERYTSTSALVNLDLDKTLNWNKSYFRDNFAAHLPVNKDARVLEIGCGYGKNLLALQALGYTRIHGIDLSSEQVTFAQDTLGLQQQVEKADALTWLHQAEGQFDCILLIDVLEHLEIKTLMALGRLIEQKLVRGGCVIVQVPNDLAPLNPFRQGDLTHLRAFTPQSLQQFFSSVDLPMKGIFSALPGRRGVGIVRRLLWRLIFNPGLSLLFFLMHGRSTFTTVFTANVIAVAQKPVQGRQSQ